MEDYNGYFPTMLRNLLQSTHTTHDVLAEYCDTSRVLISKWKNGQSSPDVRHLKKIAEYFAVSVDFLLGMPKLNTHKEILEIMADINPKEISAQIEKDNLNNWCRAIRAEIEKLV